MDNLIASSENVRKLTDAFADPDVAKNLTGARSPASEEHPPGNRAGERRAPRPDLRPEGRRRDAPAPGEGRRRLRTAAEKRLEQVTVCSRGPARETAPSTRCSTTRRRARPCRTRRRRGEICGAAPRRADHRERRHPPAGLRGRPESLPEPGRDVRGPPGHHREDPRRGGHAGSAGGGSERLRRPAHRPGQRQAQQGAPGAGPHHGEQPGGLDQAGRPTDGRPLSTVSEPPPAPPASTAPHRAAPSTDAAR